MYIFELYVQFSKIVIMRLSWAIDIYVVETVNPLKTGRDISM